MLFNPGCLESNLNPVTNNTSFDSSTIDTDEEDGPTVVEDNDQEYDLNRRIRRYSIDLLHKLPSSSDFDNYSSSDEFDNYKKSLFSNNLIFKSIAEKHRSIWNLQSRDSLADLVGFGSTTAEELADDTIETLTYHLSEGTSFSDLFKLDYSITSIGSSASYSLASSTGPSAATEVIDYNGVRPVFGIASSLGITASIANIHDSTGNTKAYSLLKKIGCLDYSGYNAHNFSDFSTTYLGSTLRSVSKVDTACASCHLQYSDFATKVPLFTPSTSLGNWTTYNSAAFQSGNYAGHSYQDENELAEFLSNDPRFKSCEVQRLIEEFLQFKLDRNAHSKIFSRVFNKLSENGNIVDAVSEIINSEEYESQIYNPSLGTTSEPEDDTGIRFLSRHHWKGIIESLVLYPVSFDLETTTFNVEPTQDVIALSPELDLRKSSFTSTSKFVPDEIYLRRVYKLALDLSSKIVEDELSAATPITAPFRKLLKFLPDGDGTGASTTQVTNQILSLWFDMTSIVISSSSAKYTELKTIYDAGAATSTSEAWQGVIYAIFISPEFLSY
jgi:hypothetical protein